MSKELPIEGQDRLRPCIASDRDEEIVREIGRALRVRLQGLDDEDFVGCNERGCLDHRLDRQGDVLTLVAGRGIENPSELDERYGREHHLLTLDEGSIQPLAHGALLAEVVRDDQPNEHIGINRQHRDAA